jgi:hypothetical protein
VCLPGRRKYLGLRREDRYMENFMVTGGGGKLKKQRGCQWFMPIILATQETDQEDLVSKPA